MQAIKLKDLKKGEWFTRKEIEYPNDNQVFIRGDYCREDKKYYNQRYSDINSEIALKGDTVVYIGFTF